MPVAPGDPAEIAAVIRVPVAELAEPGGPDDDPVSGNGEGGLAFRAGGLTIWGFTAALLDRVLALGGWEEPWDSGRLTKLAPDELPAGWPLRP